MQSVICGFELFVKEASSSFHTPFRIPEQGVAFSPCQKTWGLAPCPQSWVRIPARKSLALKMCLCNETETSASSPDVHSVQIRHGILEDCDVVVNYKDRGNLTKNINLSIYPKW